MKSILDAGLEPGDCIISSSKWIGGSIIRFFTSLITKDAWATHVGGAVNSSRAIEALYSGTRICKLKKYDWPRVEVEVYRLMLTDEKKEQFRIGAKALRNRAYGWTKLPLFFLDSIATVITKLFGKKNPIFFFTRRFSLFNIPVCSQLYVYILHKYCDFYILDGNGSRVNWRIVSPDYLHDLLSAPHNRAKLIYSKYSIPPTVKSPLALIF